MSQKYHKLLIKPNFTLQGHYEQGHIDSYLGQQPTTTAVVEKTFGNVSRMKVGDN
jgi:hypothetical protein